MNSYNFKKNQSNIIFIISSLVLFTLMLFVEINNGRFETEDFKVYYSASKALVNSQQVYGVPFSLSTGFYKYSPFTLFIFAPFTILKYKIAAIIYFYIITFSLIFSILIIQQLFDNYLLKNKKKQILTSFLILISILIHIVRDLHLGNTNMIIVFLLILALKFTLEKKEIISGLLIALAILTKPYFIVLVLPFMLYKKYKTVTSIVVAGIVLTLFTTLVLGFSRSYTLHMEWFQEMLRHSEYLYSPYTIFYLLEYYFGIIIPKTYTYPFFIVIVLLISLFFWFRNQTDNDTEKALLFNYFVLMAIIPNLLITDVEHFIFSLPIIAILILYLNNYRNYYIIALFIIAILMYGGNSTDLVGKELTIKIKFWGFVGIGNLILVSLVLFCSKRKNIKTNRNIKIKKPFTS